MARIQKNLMPQRISHQYFQVMGDWSAMKKAVVNFELYVKEDETLYVWSVFCSNFLKNSAWKSDARVGQEDFKCSNSWICAGPHQCMVLCHPQLHLGYMRSLPFSWLNLCSHYTAGMMCVLHLQSLIWGMHCTIAKCCTIIQTLNSAHNFSKMSSWPSVLLDWVAIPQNVWIKIYCRCTQGSKILSKWTHPFLWENRQILFFKFYLLPHDQTFHNV